MRTINFDEYEVGMLDRYLERLKELLGKQAEKIKPGQWNDYLYDIDKINLLLERIRKNNYRPNYQIQRFDYLQDVYDKEDRRGKSENKDKTV